MKLVGLALLGCLVVAGCQLRLTEGESTQNGVSAENNTASTLRFRTLVDGQWYDLGSVSPGNATEVIGYPSLKSATSAIAHDGCTIGVVVALDPKGKEVARHDPGLCVGDVWQIGARGVSASP